MRRLEIIQRKGAHGPALIAIDRDVSGAVWITERAGAVFDRDAGLLVDTNELGFAFVAFISLQDQAGFKAEPHAVLSQRGMVEGIFDAGHEATFRMADEFDSGRHPESQVMDDFFGGPAEDGFVPSSASAPERRPVGDLQTAAEKAIFSCEPIDQFQAQWVKFKAINKAILRLRDADWFRLEVGKHAPIGLHNKGIGDKAICFGRQVILDCKQACPCQKWRWSVSRWQVGAFIPLDFVEASEELNQARLVPAHIYQNLLRGCGNDALAASKLSPSLGVAPVDFGWEVNFPACEPGTW